MKIGHRLPLGQTVVFETYNKFKVGRIIDVRPTVKFIEYTVYGEDGKIYEGMPNRVDGMYRIDVKLTKMFCKQYDIKVDELAAEYARNIRKTYVVAEKEQTDLSVFDSQLGERHTKVNSESES